MLVLVKSTFVVVRQPRFMYTGCSFEGTHRPRSLVFVQPILRTLECQHASASLHSAQHNSPD